MQTITTYRGKFETNVPFEKILLYFLSVSIMIGTNFPFWEISGRTIYLGTNEILVAILTTLLILKLLMGKPVVIPKKIVSSIIMFSIVVPLSAIYQLLFSEIEVATSVYIEIIRWYEYVTVFFIVFLAVKTEQQIRTILLIIIICTIANIAVALYQSATFDFYAQRIYGLFVSAANREGLSVSNPNVFGAIFMANSLFLLSYVLNWAERYRHLFMVLLVLSIVVLLMSFSRSAYLGFLLGFVVMLTLYKKNILKKLSIFGAVIAVIFIGTIYFSEFLQLRLQETLDIQGGGNASNSISTRLFWWKQVIISMPDHPFFGVGYGNFYSYYNWFTPDNYYIEVLATTGILGLSLLFFMLSRILFYVYRAKADSNTFYFSFRAAYLASFIGLLVANIFSGLFFNPRILGIFWLFTALMFRLIQLNGTLLKKKAY